MQPVLANIVHWVCLIYTWLILARIVGSWFPSIARHKLMRFVAVYTDPYLNLFRRWIPPIGGVLDLSPILAFIGLRIVEHALLWLILA
jgi:YggT family protein